MIKNIHEIKECPECGSGEIIHNDKRQQVICRTCGMIYEPMAEDREKQFEKAAGIAKEED